MTNLPDRLESSQPYSGIQRLFHWLTLVLVASQFAIAWTMSDPPKGQPPVGLMSLHLSFGLTILVVTLLRLIWRVSHSVPVAPRDIPKWQQTASRATHLALYAILIGLPLAGWVWASAKGWPVKIFGLVELPTLVAARSASGSIAATVHEALGIALLGLVAIHSAAALRHHFLLKDGVLRRMLPALQDRST